MARKAKVKFEDALKRVEELVEELEAGELTLDESLAKYEEGVKALKQCYQILQQAEKRIEILVKGEGDELKTEPFAAEAAEEGNSREAANEGSDERA